MKSQLFFSVFLGLGLLRLGASSNTKNDQKSPQVIDWAYSPADLMELALFEATLHKQVSSAGERRIVDFQRPCSNFEIKWWTRDYVDSSLKMSQNLRNESKGQALISSHPFLSLRMMKRFSRITELLVTDTKDDPCISTSESNFLHHLKSYSSRFKLPNAQDVNNVLRSILQLKFVYDLNIKQLISGYIGDMDTGFGLRAEDVYDLGVYGFSIKVYTESLEWLQSLYIPSNIEGVGWNSAITGLIFKIASEHDDLINRIDEDGSLEIFHRFTNKIGSGHRLMSRREEDKIRFEETKDPSLFAAYTRLCVGADFQTEATRSRLFCWQDRTSDAAWLLNPQKVEVHSWDPYVVEFHELFGDQMLTFLRETVAGNPDTEKATIITEDDTGSILSPVTNFRASTSIHRKNLALSRLDTFNRVVSRITQLTVSDNGGQEPLQVSSYAFGGSIGPHVDNGGYKDTNVPFGSSDRVSTFMVYLNNVRRGGYTVFPYLGLSLVPRKGTALFWHNLYRNGTADSRTLHAGCPVLLGQKWIATRWMNLLDNMYRRKCSLDPLQ